MESDPLPWISLGIALALLIISNTLDVAYAFVNRSEVRRKLEDNSPGAQQVDDLLHAHSHLFLALSILKYLSLLLIGASSAYLFTNASMQWQIGVAIISGWAILALLQPIWRAFVLRHATSFTFRLVPLLQGILILLRPLTIVIDQINQWAGDNDVKNDDRTTFSDEALRLLVSNSEKSSEEIEENEREMIANILEMNETSAKELMVPRIDMVTISVETTLHDALDTIINAGHSRIPVFEENIDAIVGLLYAKDLLICFRDNQTDRPIRELLRPAYFVPASKKVDALFQEMQKQRVHIVVVVDEYGGTAGLVTIEDILEEIVGEIQDEYDLEEDAYVQGIGQDVYLLNSRLDVYSLTKLLDIEVDTDSADTLGGLLYSFMEHVPEQGESVEYDGWRFTVLSLDGRRIEQVRAEAIAVADDAWHTSTNPVTKSKHSSNDSIVNVQVADS